MTENEPQAWQLPTGMSELFGGPAIAIKTTQNCAAVFAPSTTGHAMSGTWLITQLPDDKIPLVPKAEHSASIESGAAWTWQQEIGYALGLMAGEPVLALPTAIARITELRRDLKIAQSDLDGVLQYVDHLTAVHEWLMAEIRHHATEAVAIGQWLVAQARWINEQDDEYSARKAREARAYFDWLMAEAEWKKIRQFEFYSEKVDRLERQINSLKVGAGIQDWATNINLGIISQRSTELAEAQAVAKWLMAEYRWEAEAWARWQEDVAKWLLAEARWLAEQPVDYMPTPDSTVPAHLEFAADIIEQTNPMRPVGRTARDLRYEADRIKRAQAEKAEKAAHEQHVDLLASLIDEAVQQFAGGLGIPIDIQESDWEQVARDALTQLSTILGLTPKAGRITICHVCLGSCRAPANPNQACTWCSGSGEEPHKAGA